MKKVFQAQFLYLNEMNHKLLKNKFFCKFKQIFQHVAMLKIVYFVKTYTSISSNAFFFKSVYFVSHTSLQICIHRNYIYFYCLTSTQQPKSLKQITELSFFLDSTSFLKFRSSFTFLIYMFFYLHSRFVLFQLQANPIYLFRFLF